MKKTIYKKPRKTRVQAIAGTWDTGSWVISQQDRTVHDDRTVVIYTADDKPLIRRAGY